MANPRPARKVQAQITAEWDLIAPLRHRQIESGIDLTYHHVLVPTVRSLAGDLHGLRVIDIGCGTGHLTRILAQTAKHVIGVDPSARSLEIARPSLKGLNNVELFPCSIEDFAQLAAGTANVAIANMVLMDCLSLDSALASIAKVLHPGGSLVATITHPCFWPRYWKYEDESWFSYLKEIVIDARFAISSAETDFTTTHVHRPLEMYASALAKAGFQILEIAEPVPPDEIQINYTTPWDVPRYLAFRARRVGETAPAPTLDAANFPASG